VAQDERAPSSDSPGPDPAETAGLEPGGGVAPGDTPPMSDSMSGAAGGASEHVPNQGPVSGNRTPMVVTLSILAVVVVMCAVFIVASLFAS
jgi:Family of unknown function (DUF6480)